MKSDIDHIIEQKAFNIQFNFHHQENQLIIRADSQHFQYVGCLQANPLITFDKIQKFLLADNYEIVFKSNELLKISIGGLVDLSLKGKQKITLTSLQNSIEKLNAKLQTEISKNNHLHLMLISLLGTTDSLKEELARQKQKNFKFEANLTNQRSSINSLIEKLANLENISIKTLDAEMSEIKKALLQKGLKQVILTQSNKIQNLENSFDTYKHFLSNYIQKNIENITSLNSQFTQLKTKFDQQINNNAKSVIEQNSFMKQSQVVCTLQEKSALMKFFTKPIKCVKLLYRASEHEFCAKKFHEKCDGVADTLTVIWTEFDKKIGGFTPLKWKSPKIYEYTADNQKESFIFSLTHNEKFILTQPETAICNHQICGPIFGNGCDLVVHDKANYNNVSFGRICQSYQNEKYRKDDVTSWQRFGGSTGSNKFKIKEWEVWGVEWSEVEVE